MPSDGSFSDAVSGEAAATGRASQPVTAAFGAVIGGLAAISCCVLPLVSVLVGISGAWIANLTALSPYQPFFFAIAIASIGYGHVQSYRARKACAAGAACARLLPRRLVEAGLWAGTVLVVLALAANTVAPILLT